MKVVIQRSKNSNVVINHEVYNEIDKGLVVLVCFTENDNINNIKWIVNKIVNLRIFDDQDGIMNKSILDISGSVLSISQFTLYADCTKGNRPSYKNSLNRESAVSLYDLFNEELSKYVPVKTGIFGSDMRVNIENDGPVTIILEK